MRKSKFVVTHIVNHDCIAMRYYNGQEWVRIYKSQTPLLNRRGFKVDRKEWKKIVSSLSEITRTTISLSRLKKIREMHSLFEVLFPDFGNDNLYNSYQFPIQMMNRKIDDVLVMLYTSSPTKNWMASSPTNLYFSDLDQAVLDQMKEETLKIYHLS